MDANDELPTDVPTLHTMVRELRQTVRTLEQTIVELRAELAALQAKLDQALRRRFGRCSVRTPKPVPVVPTTDDTANPARHEHGRSPLPDHLKRCKH